jgi:hypothetical protein
MSEGVSREFGEELTVGCEDDDGISGRERVNRFFVCEERTMLSRR